MPCYSHLSDAEREQIGLAKAVGHSIGAIAEAIGRPNPSRRRYRSLDSDEGLCATSQKQRTRSRPLGDSR
jgi:IS30 family transposase